MPMVKSDEEGEQTGQSPYDYDGLLMWDAPTRSVYCSKTGYRVNIIGLVPQDYEVITPFDRETETTEPPLRMLRVSPKINAYKEYEFFTNFIEDEAPEWKDPSITTPAKLRERYNDETFTKGR